jgi:HD-GYP domain-containing protein (c-di-GMP phosphodiesterase class II)
MGIVRLADPTAITARYSDEPGTRWLLDRLSRHCPDVLLHGVDVAVLTIRIGHRLGLDEDSLVTLARASLLHDVGKQDVPLEILQKPGKLDATEWAVIERHPLRGCQMLIEAGLPDEARIVLHHHERIDGTGYPTGRAGEDIPVEARILAVADAYDAMTSARPYRAALAPEAAIAELRSGAGRQHEASCVEALASIVLP